MSKFKFRASRRRARSAVNRPREWNHRPLLEMLEPRRLLSSQPYVVTVTDDSIAPGTLRSAILAANQDTDPNPFDIDFNIPASTAPELNVPVPGFNPVTQVWQITLNSPLPAITHAVSIDGFSQANNRDSVPVFGRVDRGGARRGRRRIANRGDFHAQHRGPAARGHDRHRSRTPRRRSKCKMPWRRSWGTATSRWLQLGADYAGDHFQGAYAGERFPTSSPTRRCSLVEPVRAFSSFQLRSEALPTRA